MPDPLQSHVSKHAAPKNDADPGPGHELRDVVRLDWVIYLVVVAMAVLVLAGLFGFEANPAIVGTLAAFATGIITGILTYLRLTTRSTDRKRRAGDDEEKHEAQ